MRPSSQYEESHSLRSDSSYQNSQQLSTITNEQSKLISVLIHLKQHRIFYFIVGASLLVFIAMMQIHSAYRSYEDNQRLVKLWLQEKELKDMMSNKQKQIETSQTQHQPKFVFNHFKNSTISSKNKENNQQNNLRPINLPQVPDANKSPSNPTKQITNSDQIIKKRVQTYTPRRSDRFRPIAGITRAQVSAVSRWRQQINQDINNSSQLSEQQRNYYQQKYSVSKYQELPFCIVIPSFNNAKNQRHVKNMKSVIMQNYTNYHIVFIDDASTDGTGDQIQNFLKNQSKITPDRYTVIKNEQQQRAMPNLRKAARQYCKPYEIFMIVDGDDELVGRMVLKLFNSVFQKDKVWFAYSNFISIRGNVGYSRPFPASVIKNNSFRRYPFVTSHLRAFYTQLFLNIKEEDLKDEEGDYLQAANDVAICLPILQQSHEKIRYIQQLTYFYNSNTGQNNHQIRLRMQKSNDKMIRKRRSYPPLKSFYQDKV